MFAPRTVLPDIVPSAGLGRASGLEAASYEVALLVAPVAAVPLGRHGPGAVFAAAAIALVVGALLKQVDTAPTVGTGVSKLVAVRAKRRLWPPPDGARLSVLALLLGCSGGMAEPALAVA